MSVRRASRVVMSVLLLLALAFIWGNSLLSQEQSSALSVWLQNALSRIAPGALSSGAEGEHILRKLAHAAEFAALGLLLTLWIPMEKPWMRCACALGISLCVAALDETIQLFTGRGALVADVMLDFLGAVAGAAAGLIIAFLTKRKRPR